MTSAGLGAPRRGAPSIWSSRFSTSRAGGRASHLRLQAQPRRENVALGQAAQVVSGTGLLEPGVS